MFAMIIQISNSMFMWKEHTVSTKIARFQHSHHETFGASGYKQFVFCSDILLQEALITDAIYLFNLHHATKSKVSMTCEWDTTVKTSIAINGANHYFLLVRKKEISMIIQCFFGHYTFREWCLFDKPLVQIPTPPPHDQKSPIEPHPKYRGIMDTLKLTELFAAITSLTHQGDHRQAYLDITGVSLPLDSFPPNFDIRYSTMSYNHILY